MSTTAPTIGAPARPDWINQAGRLYAQILNTCLNMTPREQAEAAWSPSSRHSIDELEQMIINRRSGRADERRALEA